MALSCLRIGRVARVTVSSSVLLALTGGCSEPSNTSQTSRTSAPSVSTNLTTKAATFPPASTIDPRAVAALGEENPERARKLGRSVVPILAPTNVTWSRPSFVVGAEFYALTGHMDDEGAHVTIAIHGTRAAHRYDGIQAQDGNQAVRTGRGFVTENDAIRTVSFVENGAAYAIDVECENRGDGRCTDPSFALGVANALGFAGGGAK